MTRNIECIGGPLDGNRESEITHQFVNGAYVRRPWVIGFAKLLKNGVVAEAPERFCFMWEPFADET
jgi:hypothetical protein